MTIPKWLLPVLSIVAALAVGVAATLIGMNFPPHTPVAAPVVNAPVLQPVDPTAKKDAKGNLPPSSAIGTSPIIGGVSVSDDKNAKPTFATPQKNDPEFDRVLKLIGGAIDPSAEIAKIQRDAGETPTLIGGDPCSPVDGKIPVGCPAGTHGAIEALTHAPDLAVVGQAYPPTQSDFESRGNPVGNLWCPTTTGGGANDVPFGILTTAPATFVVTYFPDGHSNLARHLAVDAPANVDDWQSQLAGAPTAADLPVLKQCIALPDLTPNTLYDAIVVATPPSGNIAISNLVRFNSSHHPVRPPATFTPMGNNNVIAQGLVGHEQTLTFKAFIVNDNAADSAASSHTCSVPNGQQVVATGGRRDDVSQTELQALNAPADYNLRLTEDFTVPEGATVLFCARWYSNTLHAPSWTREQPEFETSTFLGAPDRILPVLTEIGTGFLSQDPDYHLADVFIWAQTVTGIHCGNFVNLQGDVSPGLDPGRHALCDSSEVESRSTGPEGGRFWDQPFTGNLVVGSEAYRYPARGFDPDTHFGPTYAQIPAGLQNCFGVCTLPAPTTFVLPIGPAYYDCSHPQLGVCTPQPGSGWGQYEIELSWKQGLTNGVGVGWGTTGVNDVSLDWHQPDTPRMNTDLRLVAQADAAADQTATVSFNLQADRPVHYEADLFNLAGFAPGGPIAPACRLDGITSYDHQTGAAANDTSIIWTDVCLGQAVGARITLTDDATGLVSTYDVRTAPAGSPIWGTHGVAFIAPGEAARTIHVAWQFISLSQFGWVSESTFFYSEYRGTEGGDPTSSADLRNEGDPCDSGPTFSGTSDVTGTLAPHSEVDLDFTLTTPGADCASTAHDRVVVVPIDPAALLATGRQASTVTLEDGGVTFQAVVTLTL